MNNKKSDFDLRHTGTLPVFGKRQESIMQAAVLAVVPIVVRYLGEIIAAFRADVKVTPALDRWNHHFDLNFLGCLFQVLFLFVFFGQFRARSHVATLLGQKPF